MSAPKDKPETALEVSESAILPNLVTHVGQSDDALNAIIAAMEREMAYGRQFYAMKVHQTWGVFYNGPIAVH